MPLIMDPASGRYEASLTRPEPGTVRRTVTVKGGEMTELNLYARELCKK